MSEKVREWGVTSYSGRFKLIHIDSADQEDILEGHVDYDDARLIAAAPELLDALEYLRAEREGVELDMVDLRVVDEAIAKARGE